MTSPKNHKLDIFQVLDRISTKTPDFYNNLSDEEQKALQPLVVMRWMTGTQSPTQIYFLNEIVNPLVFPLSKHKGLLVDLMSICSPGRKQRYQWNKAQSKRKTSMPNVIDIICEFFGYNISDAMDALPLLTDETILWYADQLGRQPDELKLIKKELSTRERS